MIKEKASRILNAFEITVDYSAHVILDKTWCSENVCDIYSRLYYVKSGTGFLICRDETIQLEPGYVYLIPSGCKFSYGCEELEKIYFHFSVPTIEKYDLLSDVNKICKMEFDEKKYQELFKLCYSDDYMSTLNLKIILYSTILDFSKKYSFNSVIIKKYSDPVKKIMLYIQKNTKINLNARVISQEVFISESKIRKIFKDETGITLGKYIDDLVFLKARKYLSDKDMSIKNISDRLGFCDQFYFSRRFKELYGKTPTQYRRSIKI